MSHDTLLSLSERIDAQVYGGKAARLSVSLRARLPVPPGYVLHPDGVARIAQGNLTSQERTLLESALTPFTERAVAVRSSAVGEDGAAASFAGQYTSILNVYGMDTILAAIATVWASGQIEAARQYRARMEIAGRARVAVILQAFVRAEVAGVLFTVDPLSGSGERWIVEASWGLGEAVVSGLVTPDRYIISHRSLARELPG
jgi:pyruvate, water dikinase